MISLLQAYFDHRNAGAYSQKAKINNLKEMNALFNYLMENGIHDLDTLEARVDALRNSSDAFKTKLDSQTARMKEIRKLPDYLATYHEMKPVYDGLQKIKFTRSKEKYKADHAAELKQFYEARRKLSAQFPDGKFDRQKLDAEYVRLEQEHAETYAQFQSIREDSQQLWKIKSHVDSARKNLEQVQQHTSHNQEDAEAHRAQRRKTETER